MDRYVVTMNFKDRYTGKYYGIGSIFETDNEERAAELERGGYIAPENTEAARFAMQQAELNRQATQNAEEVSKAHSQIQTNAEAKTVVNGKVVSITQAQKAEAAANAEMKQTGIRDIHNNVTEPVEAGQVASQQQQQGQQQQGQATTASTGNVNYDQQVKHVQSGQQHLEEHISNQNNTGSQSNQTGSQTNQTDPQQNKPAAMIEAEEAAKTAQAAEEAKAKNNVRAKKDQQ